MVPVAAPHIHLGNAKEGDFLVACPFKKALTCTKAAMASSNRARLPLNVLNNEPFPILKEGVDGTLRTNVLSPLRQPGVILM